MWLYFALLAPLFFGIVHVIDKYCVEDIFEKPWFGMITSALASLIIFAPLPYLLPLITWHWPALNIILMALAAGALIQLSQGFYFQSLAYSEAGIVAAYWNMVPAFVPILSFFILNERLSAFSYIGIAILIFGSTAFCLIDSNRGARWKSFGLMFIAALMQTIMFLLQDVVYANSGFLEAFLIITTGLIIAGCSPLLFKNVRNHLSSNSRLLIPAAKLFVIVEVANLIALALSQKAVDLGVPSLVAAVESTIPAYTFVLLMILTNILPKFGDPEAKKRIMIKFPIIAAMVFGVSLLA
jgi:drug/metabolite transporter (DMT)-like permease